jgi:hypothetical protein
MFPPDSWQYTTPKLSLFDDGPASASGPDCDLLGHYFAGGSRQTAAVVALKKKS